MNAREFITDIEIEVEQAAIRNTLEILSEPDEKPTRTDPLWRKTAQWYVNLPDDDKEKVEDVIKITSESAIFRFLCYIKDTPIPFEDDEIAGFELYHIEDGSKTLINGASEEHDFLDVMFMSGRRIDK